MRNESLGTMAAIMAMATSNIHPETLSHIARQPVPAKVHEHNKAKARRMRQMAKRGAKP